MNAIILHECSDWDVIYGVILTAESEDVVQSAIYNIKRKFYRNDIYDWTVEDVLNELDFDFEFVVHNHAEI